MGQLYSYVNIKLTLNIYVIQLYNKKGKEEMTMSENERLSYVSILKFKSLRELQDDLAKSEAAIRRKTSSGTTGDYYFKREALRNMIEKNLH